MLRTLAVRAVMLGYHAGRSNVGPISGRWLVAFVSAAPAFAVQLFRRTA
jgi:hypothetical protein